MSTTIYTRVAYPNSQLPRSERTCVCSVGSATYQKDLLSQLMMIARDHTKDLKRAILYKVSPSSVGYFVTLPSTGVVG